MEATAGKVNAPSEPLYHRLDDSINQIRLISVNPSDDKDRIIECKLVTVALEDAEPYDALSYVWGDPAITAAIYVNGHQLNVTTNLVAFLRQYRSHSSSWSDQKPSWLWVDAISINQDDLDERGRQIQLMGSIYKDCRMMYSWLGDSFPDCEMAFAVIGTVISEGFSRMALTDGNLGNVEWLNKYPELCEEDTSPGIYKNTSWDSLRTLTELEYWRRIWIFQELVLGTSGLLVCGTHTIPTGAFGAALLWLSESQRRDESEELQPPTNMAEALWAKLSSRHFTGAAMRLEPFFASLDARLDNAVDGFDLLRSTRDMEATNSLDRIFGLLGVWDFGVPVDYKKSVKDVYLSIAVSMLEKKGFDDLLCSGGLQNEADLGIHDLPSWVVDWSRLAANILADPHSYSASRSDRPWPAPTVSGSSLHVRGIICDEVEMLDSPSDERDMANYSTCYLERYKGSTYPSGITHLQAVIQVLLLNSPKMYLCRLEPGSVQFQVMACVAILYLATRIRLKIKDRDPCEVLGLTSPEAGLFEAPPFKRKMVGDTVNYHPLFGELQPPSSVYDEIKEESGQGFACMILLNEIARMFHTRAGYVGAVRNGMPGDLVCVLLGCSFPVLLRPKGDHFLYVAPCYVVGLMDGEAMDALRAGKMKEREFEIR